MLQPGGAMATTAQWPTTMTSPPRASPRSSRLRQSVDLIGRIMENETDLFRNKLRVQVGRAAEIFGCLRLNKLMMRRNVMAYLRNCGYNAAVCKTNWPSSGSLSGGSYEFIDVDSASVDRKRRRDVRFELYIETVVAETDE
ncbi:hypothetical protein SASPL_133348 [Salvia splendens]|uniref:Uncharacterized protein n=1 Tax=Salvia splendens TaxID=180675 RepID=A0A8X8X406_SALSN|nr:hypothetical protein SASPL_133348 [Salvia splendens]